MVLLVVTLIALSVFGLCLWIDRWLTEVGLVVWMAVLTALMAGGLASARALGF